ncbi:MAG TPA: LLM class flavin-dependent oxidoreductase, partial [Candidatus Dormibacteraeota bacterium]
RLWEASGGHFVLGLGSGQLRHPAHEMGPYLDRLRSLLPPRLPLYLAALGPRMLRVAAERADGVSLNWCTADQVVAARAEVEQAARSGGRPVPPIASYIRTAVAPDRERASAALGDAMRDYALGPVVYRRHFERMGFREDLNRLEVERGQPSAAMLSAVGVAAEPGAGRQRFLQQARGLDLAIVRVLVTAPGDASSARRVLEECRPR